MKWLYIAMSIIIIGLLVTIAMLYFTPTTAPWEPTGQLVVIAYAIPSPGIDAELSLDLGIDDVTLVKVNGDTVRATLLTRRLYLGDDTATKYFLIETDVAIGAYSRIEFYIRSPELRNAWEQDEAPAHVSLAGEFVSIDTPFTISENETTAILLGFETLQSIRETDTGNVYLPVIQTETRANVTISKDTENTGHVEGGIITTSATYGMNWDGVMRFNYRAPRAAPSTEPKTRLQQNTPKTPPVSMVPEDAKPASSTSATTTVTESDAETEPSETL